MYHMNKMLSGLRSLKRRVAGVTMPINRKRMKWGRNWLCLCGSGKKYKQCCLAEITILTASDSNAVVEQLPEDVRNLIDDKNSLSNDPTIGFSVGSDGKVVIKYDR